MIIPLADEAQWQAALDSLPRWDDLLAADVRRAVVVSPHPDDETLGAGGLIAALREAKIEVILVAVTDGENAYEGVTGLGDVRAVEQVNAARQLGVDNELVRLHLTDGEVAAQEEKLERQLGDLLDSHTLLVAPWTGDFHPDHEACGRAAQRAAQRTGAKLIFYFFWTWHRATPDLLEGLPLRRLVLKTEWLAAKQAALQEHESQLHRDSGEPILPDNLLGPARRAYEVYLFP